MLVYANSSHMGPVDVLLAVLLVGVFGGLAVLMPRVYALIYRRSG